MQTECVYGIVDKGITVVNGKLVIPEGASEACVDLFDGVHRATVATEMEAEGNADFEIPSFLFAHGTPASIWLPLAFARMELNNFSDGYTTIDLLHVMDIIVTNRINDGLSTPTAEQIQEAIYGKQARDSTKSATLQLTQSMLMELYIFYDRLKSTNLLAVVATLASADHSIQAQKCRSLLDSTLDTVFVGGACFLAPLLRPTASTKGNGATVSRVGRGPFFPLAIKHKGLFQTGKHTSTTFAPFTRGELREMILWAYSKWLLSGGDYPAKKDWKDASNAIKQGETDLQKLQKQAERAIPSGVDLFTLELLAVQTGLLAQAAKKLNWQSLLALSLSSFPNTTTTTTTTTTFGFMVKCSIISI
jgi:hypothetical protein